MNSPPCGTRRPSTRAAADRNEAPPLQYAAGTNAIRLSVHCATKQLSLRSCTRLQYGLRIRDRTAPLFIATAADNLRSCGGFLFAHALDPSRDSFVRTTLLMVTDAARNSPQNGKRIPGSLGPEPSLARNPLWGCVRFRRNGAAHFLNRSIKYACDFNRYECCTHLRNG